MNPTVTRGSVALLSAGIAFVLAGLLSVAALADVKGTKDLGSGYGVSPIAAATSTAPS